MATISSRIARITAELQFKYWIRRERIRDSFSLEELRVFSATGRSPERPEPPPGASRFDNMTRSELLRLWKEEKQWWAGRNDQELRFYTVHGHWPEQGCREPNCGKDRFNASEGGN